MVIRAIIVIIIISTINKIEVIGSIVEIVIIGSIVIIVVPFPTIGIMTMDRMGVIIMILLMSTVTFYIPTFMLTLVL